MSLANIKRRLTLGTPLRLVRHDWGFSEAIGKVRKVVHVQNSAVAFEPLEGHTKPSWLYFPSASHIRETPHGFSVDLDDASGSIMEYEWVTEEQAKESQDAQNAAGNDSLPGR